MNTMNTTIQVWLAAAGLMLSFKSTSIFGMDWERCEQFIAHQQKAHSYQKELVGLQKHILTKVLAMEYYELEVGKGTIQKKEDPARASQSIETSAFTPSEFVSLSNRWYQKTPVLEWQWQAVWKEETNADKGIFLDSPHRYARFKSSPQSAEAFVNRINKLAESQDPMIHYLFADHKLGDRYLLMGAHHHYSLIVSFGLNYEQTIPFKIYEEQGDWISLVHPDEQTKLSFHKKTNTEIIAKVTALQAIHNEDRVYRVESNPKQDGYEMRQFGIQSGDSHTGFRLVRERPAQRPSR